MPVKWKGGSKGVSVVFGFSSGWLITTQTQEWGLYGKPHPPKAMSREELPTGPRLEGPSVEAPHHG